MTTPGFPNYSPNPLNNQTVQGLSVPGSQTGWRTTANPGYANSSYSKPSSVPNAADVTAGGQPLATQQNTQQGWGPWQSGGIGDPVEAPNLWDKAGLFSGQNMPAVVSALNGPAAPQGAPQIAGAPQTPPAPQPQVQTPQAPQENVAPQTPQPVTQNPYQVQPSPQQQPQLANGYMGSSLLLEQNMPAITGVLGGR